MAHMDCISKKIEYDCSPATSRCSDCQMLSLGPGSVSGSLAPSQSHTKRQLSFPAGISQSVCAFCQQKQQLGGLAQIFLCTSQTIPLSDPFQNHKVTHPFYVYVLPWGRQLYSLFNSILFSTFSNSILKNHLKNNKNSKNSQ